MGVGSGNRNTQGGEGAGNAWPTQAARSQYPGTKGGRGERGLTPAGPPVTPNSKPEQEPSRGPRRRATSVGVSVVTPARQDSIFSLYSGVASGPPSQQVCCASSKAELLGCEETEYLSVC